MGPFRCLSGLPRTVRAFRESKATVFSHVICIGMHKQCIIRLFEEINTITVRIGLPISKRRCHDRFPRILNNHLNKEIFLLILLANKSIILIWQNLWFNILKLYKIYLSLESTVLLLKITESALCRLRILHCFDFSTYYFFLNGLSLDILVGITSNIL